MSERAHPSRLGFAFLLLWWYSFRVPRGTPSPKLAITVDPDVHKRVLAIATQDGLSVSAWMTNAARQALLVRDGLAAVAEWETMNGALSPAEIQAARDRVSAESKPKARRTA